MKLSHLLALVSILTAPVANAQLVVVSLNFLEDPPTAPAILTADGTVIPIGGGHVAVGTFSITDHDIQGLLHDGNITGILSAWVQHGNSGVLDGLGDNVAGYFEIAPHADTLASGLGNKTIYTLITNTAMPEDHSELLIFRHNAIFPVVETPTVDTLTVRLIPDSGTLVWGGFGNYLFDVEGLGPTSAYNTLAAVPESSVSAALLGLGALAAFMMYCRRR